MLAHLKSARRIGLAIVFVAVLITPGMVMGTIWVENAWSVFFFGAIPVAGAVFGGNQRLAPRFAFLTAGTAALGVVVAGNTILSTLVLATVAGLVGLTAKRGQQSPGIMMTITLGFLIVSPAVLSWRSTGEQITGNMLVVVVFAFILGGGLWASAIGFVVRKRIPAGALPVTLDSQVVIPYALSLFVATGLAAFGALTFGTDGLGAWIILTVVLVVQPDTASMRAMVTSRVLGTLAGGVIAVAALSVLQSMNLEHDFAQLLVALILIGLAMSYFQSGPYWKYVIFLTPGVILMDSNRVSDQILVAELRVGFTLLGAVIAVLVAVGVKSLASKVHYSGS